MVRVLHTGDWHIGQTLRGYSREYEHSQVFAQLVRIVAEREIDVLIVAGDIFDNQNPSAESQRLFYETIQRLHSARPTMSTIIIAGNHDAAGRLEAPHPLLARFGVSVVGSVRRRDGKIDPERHHISLTNTSGETFLHVLAVSYPTAACLPNLVRLDDESGSPVVKAVQQVYDELFDSIYPKLQGIPLIVTGHLHVMGGVESEGSERRILVGGQHAVPHSVFPADATYVALGHLHKAQPVGINTVRYSGSLIPLSATEQPYRHSVTLLLIDGTTTTIEDIPLERPVAFLRLPLHGEMRLTELSDHLTQLGFANDLEHHLRPFVQVRLAERAGTAVASLAIAESVATESHSEREDAVRLIAEADLQIAGDSAARSLLIPLNDLAEQSISEQADHLRGFVLDGKECPVCGAIEHPYLVSGEGLEPSGALKTLADSLRRQRHELDAAIQVSTSTRTQAMGKLAAAEARNSQAAINTQAARIDAAKAQSDYAELKPTLATILVTHGLPNELPEILDGDAPSLIAERGQLAKAAYLVAKKGLAGARELRAELEQVQKQETEAQKSFETKTTNHLLLTAQKHGAELVLEQERANQRQNKTELDSVERDLNPFLASIGLGVETLYRDPIDVLARVNEEVHGYRTLKTKIAELELLMRRLEPALAAAKADTSSRKEQQVNCKAALEQRRASLELKLKERKQLLGGEATAYHRTRHNQIRLAAIAERQLRHTQQGNAASEYRGAIVASENAKVAREDAELLASSTQNSFLEACAGIDRSAAWVMERLLMPASLRDEIRERLRGIDDAVTTSQAKRTTRFSDVETASMAVDESESIADLSSSLVLLGQQITVKQNEMGENAANLKRDDQAQANAATLATEIEAKRKHLAVWQAVDDAIGSADGSRFRKFVQGITLEHLIMLANDHLSALGPRYQLSQAGSSELAVHVIDKEMADELRAARSLSGGERFLVSLSLALALSGLEGRSSFVDTLFIDEGFGTLDRDTLDVAVDALETLQSHGRKVAVITHVAAMIDRIAVQVQVEKLGGGHSVIKLTDGVMI